MNTAIVIPSNRKLTREFLEPIGKEPNIYVVNDHEEDIPIDTQWGNIRRLRYSDQHKVFENEYHRQTFMSRKTAGCRNFGIWQAYKDGADIIINLDDDVIVPESFVLDYETILTSVGRNPWPVVSNRKWANTINSFEWFARGFPYEDRIGYAHSVSLDLYPSMVSLIHMGLWDNVLDFNGIDKLSLDGSQPPQTTGYNDSLYWAPNQYIPICGMNCGARREAAMGLLQIPMGHEFYNRYPMYRIEDIWGGYLWQSLYPNTVSFGQPIGRHLKEGNRDWEIIVENYSIVLAKEFERAIDESMVGIIDRPNQWERYHDLAWHLDRYANGVMQFEHNPCPPYFREFVWKLSRTLDCWEKMFSPEYRG